MTSEKKIITHQFHFPLVLLITPILWVTFIELFGLIFEPTILGCPKLKLLKPIASDHWISSDTWCVQRQVVPVPSCSHSINYDAPVHSLASPLLNSIQNSAIQIYAFRTSPTIDLCVNAGVPLPYYRRLSLIAGLLTARLQYPRIPIYYHFSTSIISRFTFPFTNLHPRSVFNQSLSRILKFLCLLPIFRSSDSFSLQFCPPSSKFSQ